MFGMGDLNAKKNYHVLLPLLQNNPDIDMVIAGRLAEPDYVTNFKQQAEAMGIADHLYITGPVPEEEKAWYLHNCLAFVHPSLAKGFGAPVVEAMNFGKPLFLSNRTSLPEIGGNIAFYFSSFEPEQMQMIYREGMQRYINENMSVAITNRGKEFDWEKNAIKYLEVYKSLY
ncbi:MAG: glycosyltransferase [Chitinophagaceae bacterium]